MSCHKIMTGNTHVKPLFVNSKPRDFVVNFSTILAIYWNNIANIVKLNITEQIKWIFLGVGSYGKYRIFLYPRNT